MKKSPKTVVGFGAFCCEGINYLTANISRYLNDAPETGEN